VKGISDATASYLTAMNCSRSGTRSDRALLSGCWQRAPDVVDLWGAIAQRDDARLLIGRGPARIPCRGSRGRHHLYQRGERRRPIGAGDAASARRLLETQWPRTITTASSRSRCATCVHRRRLGSAPRADLTVLRLRAARFDDIRHREEALRLLQQQPRMASARASHPARRCGSWMDSRSMTCANRRCGGSSCTPRIRAYRRTMPASARVVPLEGRALCGAWNRSDGKRRPRMLIPEGQKACAEGVQNAPSCSRIQVR